ncbi:MAG: nucleotidyltransferase family protein [Proteobacteria bacterium]|nr:nucleotidyltransferase family protein [Pseudomonadota bacterium]
MTIGAIILAAGSSRRFGDDKRKSVLETGKTVLATCIENADACFDEVLVVLRFGDREYANELTQAFDRPAITFFCAPDSAKGMAHSLANAIAGVKDWDAATILLGDMPYLTIETIRLMLEKYTGAARQEPIIVPTHDGEQGHPVIFHHRYFSAIERLKGDQGARSVIQENAAKVIEVPVDDAGILRDIDTHADL